MREKQLYSIDEQGQIRFGFRRSLLKHAYQTESIQEQPIVSLLVMMACGILDFVMFQQLFASFLYDSVLVQRLSIVAMLVGFDLGPIYLGASLKKRKQGLNASLLVMALFLAAFVIAFAANVMLRINLRDLVLPDYSHTMTSVFGEVRQENTGSDRAMLYAIFASVMPLITSLVSFGVSYQCANPLKAKQKRLQEEQVELEEGIAQIEAILLEYDTDENLLERMLREDEEKYQAMLAMIDEKTFWYRDYVRERIKEHLGDPAANSELSRDDRTEFIELLGGTGTVSVIDGIAGEFYNESTKEADEGGAA